MTNASRELKSKRALDALTALARDGVRKPTRSDLERGLNVLCARVSAGRVRRGGGVRWVVLAGAGIGFLSFLLVLYLAPLARRGSAIADSPLDYRVEGGRLLDGGYLRETGRTGAKLLFNEGSRVELKPGSRGRLREVTKQGARVAIDNGTASFRVTPSMERRWWVEAGPFVVTVKGTAFLVSWEPSSERFELDLRQGSVVVGGPVTGGELALRAGQRLVVDLSKSEALISENGTEVGIAESVAKNSSATSSAQPPSAEHAKAAATSAAPTSPATSTVVGVGNQRRWAQALASGQWDRILEDVERTGLDTALNTTTSEELFALANAARYRQRTDLARAALLAERRRFPDSPRAIEALFLLGRVEESNGGNPAGAIAWYDEYLARAPTGGYAAEALGRKMIIAKSTGGLTQARTLAEQYLRRFPKGSYAGSARALLRAD